MMSPQQICTVSFQRRRLLRGTRCRASAIGVGRQAPTVHRRRGRCESQRRFSMELVRVGQLRTGFVALPGPQHRVSVLVRHFRHVVHFQARYARLLGRDDHCRQYLAGKPIAQLDRFSFYQRGILRGSGRDGHDGRSMRNRKGDVCTRALFSGPDHYVSVNAWALAL